MDEKLEELPNWMVPGVIFKWSNPEAVQCHYKILEVRNRTEMFLEVVEPHIESDRSERHRDRPIGYKCWRSVYDCRNNPVIVRSVKNYNRSTYEYRYRK